MLSEGRRRQLHVLLAVVLDACTIAAAFSLAYLLRFFWELVPASDSPPVGPYVAILPVLIPVWIVVFAAYGLYRERLQGFFDEALRVTSAVSVGMMTLLAGCRHAAAGPAGGAPRGRPPRDHRPPRRGERGDAAGHRRVPGGGSTVCDRPRPVRPRRQRRRCGTGRTAAAAHAARDPPGRMGPPAEGCAGYHRRAARRDAHPTAGGHHRPPDCAGQPGPRVLPATANWQSGRPILRLEVPHHGGRRR